MDYDNYIELYEAIYCFDKICRCHDNELSELISIEKNKLEINENTYKAIIRILVVNDLLDYDGNCFIMSSENKQNHRHILDNIISENTNKNYLKFFNKAINKCRFFFDSISDSECEIYSRYNFEITSKIGKEIVKYINFANRNVLEIGGNSGGLGTTVLTKYKDCIYTIIDTKIPCMVGNEIKKLNNSNITFIEGNAFEMISSNKLCDYVILMNFLHDFDDIKCLNIIRNCAEHCDKNTKFIIIEDILTSEFEPKEAIMHGLRLSVECRGGKQRTIKEFISMFLKIDYKLEKTIKLDNIHSMLIMMPSSNVTAILGS